MSGLRGDGLPERVVSVVNAQRPRFLPAPLSPLLLSPQSSVLLRRLADQGLVGQAGGTGGAGLGILSGVVGGDAGLEVKPDPLVVAAVIAAAGGGPVLVDATGARLGHTVGAVAVRVAGNGVR